LKAASLAVEISFEHNFRVSCLRSSIDASSFACPEDFCSSDFIEFPSNEGKYNRIHPIMPVEKVRSQECPTIFYVADIFHTSS